MHSKPFITSFYVKSLPSFWDFQGDILQSRFLYPEKLRKVRLDIPKDSNVIIVILLIQDLL